MTRSTNPFGFTGNPVFAVAVTILWVGLLVVMRNMPQWDLAASGWFFDANRCAETASANGQYCGGFPLDGDAVLAWSRRLMHPLPAILGGVLLLMLAFDHRAGLRWRDAEVRLKVVLVLALVIGPGLIVNGVLKADWGRPRPWMTENFGGWLPFVPAGRISDYCQSNCSFVSGEAAAAGWLMCLALLLFAWRRPLSGAAVAILAVFMAGLRLSFGAHYLSDVVLGFLSTIVLFSILAWASENLGVRRR